MSPTRFCLACLVSIGFLLSGLPSVAAPLRLGQDIPVEVFTERSPYLSIEELTSPQPPERFVPWPDQHALSLPAGSHWLKAQLSTDQLSSQGGWLELSPVLLPQVRVYQRTSPSLPWEPLGRSSEQSPTNRTGAFHLPLPDADNDELALLIHVVTDNRVTLRASVWTMEDYALQALRGALQWGFYFGLALMSALLALALALVLRNRTLLAISAFGFTYVFSGLQGFMGWWLEPGTVLLSGQTTVAVMILAEVTMLWFAREALDIRQHFPRLDMMVLGVMSVLLLSLCLLPFWTRIPLIPVVYTLSGSTKLLLGSLGFVLWWQHGWRYGVMALAYALLALASIASFMSAFGWVTLLPLNFIIWQYFIISLLVMTSCVLTHGILRHRKDMQAAQRLGIQLDTEREASFRQRQFVAMVSHEFRTPLSIITAAARNLQRRLEPGQPIDTTDSQQRLERILRASHRLVQLTDNCLADARLDRQLDHLEIERLDLLALVREASDIVALSDNNQLILRCQGIDVTDMADQSTAPACTMRGDPALLRIAFSNVLDNAVKYSEGGAISVSIDKLENDWRIAVENKGQGIPVSMQDVIFKPYVSANGSQGGTGLGLAVAEKIARAHGGTLRLASGHPEHTQFVFFLPGMDTAPLHARQVKDYDIATS